MSNDGHKDTHGPPRGGWATFDKDGKRIRETPAPAPKPKRKAAK